MIIGSYYESDVLHLENIHPLQMLIRQQYHSLTASEKRIANYVLNNFESISNMRIHDLAVLSSVTNSAVIRFCKTLGFSGFSEFKFNLSSKSTDIGEVYMLPTIKRGDGVEEIFNKVFASNIHSLYETIQHLNMEQAAQAVELMDKANQIVFMGTGPSEMTAMHAVFHLMQFGHHTSYATNGVTMRTSAINLCEADVAIGISYCGHTCDTADALELAKKSGAKTIAITSYEDSPLCKYADIVLHAPPEDIPYMSDGALTSTRNSLTCIIDSLIITLACKNYDNSMSKLHARNTRIFTKVRK